MAPQAWHWIWSHERGEFLRQFPGYGRKLNLSISILFIIGHQAWPGIDASQFTSTGPPWSSVV
jgi:hypothetical protein